MKRCEATEVILAAKAKRGLTFDKIAEAVGRSKVWTTAAIFGQATMSAQEAGKLAEVLGLSSEVVAVLQEIPYRGSSQAVPNDPLIYRFYELIQVYGPTWKAIIHEMFGDGIMSAIDFDMTLERLPDPKGDRVKITMSGKFLPYKTY